MTVEDQDAVVGRLVREKKAAEVKRTVLEAEAQRISTNLHTLAQNLDKKLAGIQLQGMQLEADFLTWEAWVSPASLEEPKRIIPLANEYRETLTKLKMISKQLKQIGVE